MTTYNKQTLGTFFQTNDIPLGQDYQNLIDSQVNIAETSAQVMAGPLVPTELITSRVSATNANVVTLLSAGTINAVNLTISTDVSATTGTVYTSALRVGSELYRAVGIVSAFGTAQATATTLTFGINRGQGVTDAQATGFILQANRTGAVQYLAYEGTVSANLWPCVGGSINGGSTNAAFALATKTLYTITHITASAHYVK